MHAYARRRSLAACLAWPLTTSSPCRRDACLQCKAEYDFRLGCPYPFLVDPTRKLNKLTRLVVFERDEVRRVAEGTGGVRVHVAHAG